MSFNHIPTTPKRNFFAQQAAMALNGNPSFTNLDEIYGMQPLTDRAPRRNQPSSISSLSNLDDNDRQFGLRREEGNFNRDRAPKKLTILPSIARPGYQPMQNYPSSNNLNAPQNPRPDMMAPNSYAIQRPHLQKNYSVSDLRIPQSYESNLFKKPIQFNMAPPPLYQNQSLPPNINAYNGRGYNLIPQTTRNNDSRFDQLLDRQQKLLDNLMSNLDKPKSYSSTNLDLSYDPGNTSLQSNNVAYGGKYRPPNEARPPRTLNQIDEQAEPASREGTVILVKKVQPVYEKIEEQDSISSESISPVIVKKSIPIYKKLRTLKTKEITNDIDCSIVEKSSALLRNEAPATSLKYIPDEEEDDDFVKPSTRTKKKKGTRNGDKSLKSVNDLDDVKGGRKNKAKSQSRIIVDDNERRKNRAKSKLRTIGWTLTYYKLLFTSVKDKVLTERQSFLRTVSENLYSLNNTIESYVLEIAGKQIQDMLMDKSFDYLLTVEKPANDKKREKECQALYVHIKTILDKLFTYAKTLPNHFFTLLSSLTEEDSLLPNDYFTDFELRRQQFSYFGKLKYVSAAKSKILIGGIITRALVKIFTKPWEAFRVDQKKFNIEKLLNIGSIIYNLIMEVLKGLVPIFHNNQAFLPVELKTKPKKVLLQAFDLTDSGLKAVIQKDSTRDGEIIEGFLAKQQLGCFFVQRKKLVDEMKSLIYGWFDYLHEASHEAAQKASKK